jgi:hypothetical protein
MAGDFNKPALGDNYTAFASAVRDIVADMIKGLDPALSLGTTNVPTNAIRWNSANKYHEKYNGSTWSALSADYAITITGSAAKWTTGRTIALTGAVTGTSGAFDGSGNLSFATTLATVTADKGGTGQAGDYAIGDVLYASGASALSKLADVATGNVLLSGGVGVAPSYGKVGLTTHVSGTLPVANGGTNITSYAVGDIVYASGASALSKLADVATGNVLLSGGVGVAPSYGKVGLTTHVSGALPVANGGTGATDAAGARAALDAAALAGSSTQNFAAQALTLSKGLNEARGTVAMHATTMDLWAQPNVIDGTGSAVTVTAIANAPQGGVRRTLYPVAGSIITNGATFAVDGAANHTAAAGDKWEFEAITTSTYNVHVTKKDGTAVASGTNSPATYKAIFGYGYTGSSVSMTNLVNNLGVVATDTTGVGTARYATAAAGYGTDKAIFGYGYTVSSVSMTNLVNNLGVVATDTTGVGTARDSLAAADY